MSKYHLRSHEDLSGYLDLLDSTYELIEESSQHFPSLSDDPHEIIQDLLSQLVNTRKKALEMIKIAKKFYKVQEDSSKMNSSLVSEIHALQSDINSLSSRLSSQSKEIDTKDKQFDTMALELHETEREYRSILIEVDELRKELKTLRERKKSPSVKERKSLLKVQELKLEEIRMLNTTIQDYRDELNRKVLEVNDLNEKLKEINSSLSNEKNNSEKNKGFLNELKNENRGLREKIEELEISLDAEKNSVCHLENEVIKQKSYTDNLVKEYDRQKRASVLGNSFASNDLLHYIDELNKNDEDKKIEEKSSEEENSEKEEEVLPLYKKRAPKIETLGDWIDEEKDYVEIDQSEPALSKQPKLFILSSPVVNYEKRFQFPLDRNLEIEKCENLGLMNYKKSSAKSTFDLKKVKKSKKVFTFDEFENGDNITPIQQSKELKIFYEKNIEIIGKNKGLKNICNEESIEIKHTKKSANFAIKNEENLEIKTSKMKLEAFQGFSNKKINGLFKGPRVDIEKNYEITFEKFEGFSLKSEDSKLQIFSGFSLRKNERISFQFQEEIMITPKDKNERISFQVQEEIIIRPKDRNERIDFQVQEEIAIRSKDKNERVDFQAQEEITIRPKDKNERIDFQAQEEIIIRPKCKILSLSNECLINYHPEKKQLNCTSFPIFSKKQRENLIEHGSCVCVPRAQKHLSEHTIPPISYKPINTVSLHLFPFSKKTTLNSKTLKNINIAKQDKPKLSSSLESQVCVKKEKKVFLTCHESSLIVLNEQKTKIEIFKLFSNTANLTQSFTSKFECKPSLKNINFEYQSSISIDRAKKILSFSKEKCFLIKPQIFVSLSSYRSISKHNFPVISNQFSSAFQSSKKKTKKICSESTISVVPKTRKFDLQSLDFISIKNSVRLTLQNFSLAGLNERPLVLCQGLMNLEVVGKIKKFTEEKLECFHIKSKKKCLNESIESCIYVCPITQDSSLSEFKVFSLKSNLGISKESASLTINKVIKKLEFFTGQKEEIRRTEQNIKLESYQNLYKSAVLNIEHSSCFKIQTEKTKLFSFENLEVASVSCKNKVDSSSQDLEVLENSCHKGFSIKQDLSLNHGMSLFIASHKTKVFSLSLENSLSIKNKGKSVSEIIEKHYYPIYSQPCPSISLSVYPIKSFESESNSKYLNKVPLSVSLTGFFSIPSNKEKFKQNLDTRKCLEMSTSYCSIIFPNKREAVLSLHQFCIDVQTEKPKQLLLTLPSELSMHPYCKQLEISETFNLAVEGSSYKLLNESAVCSVQNLIRSSSSISSGKRDPIKDFFTLTCQSIKLNSKKRDKIGQIPFDDLYKCVQKDHIPFHNWYVYLKEKVESINKV